MLKLPIRAAALAALLAVGLFAMHALHRPEPVLARTPLRFFPANLGGWNGRDLAIDPREIEAVGVTDYINRVYTNPAAVPIELYVGYYASQRTGDTIHSPKNCLPGAGWVPLHSDILPIALAGGRTIRVNEYLVEKEESQALVLYWYQSRGRAIASEYSAKFWMVADALRSNRTDGALVRLWTPMVGSDAPARAAAVNFARAVDPVLPAYVPN